MTSFFYNLGKKVGPKVRKGKWLWHSLTGTEADAIAAELAVGKDLALEIIRQTGVDPDPKVKDLLDKISSRLTPCVANKLRITIEGQCRKHGKVYRLALKAGQHSAANSALIEQSRLCGLYKEAERETPGVVLLVLGAPKSIQSKQIESTEVPALPA